MRTILNTLATVLFLAIGLALMGCSSAAAPANSSANSSDGASRETSETARQPASPAELKPASELPAISVSTVPRATQRFALLVGIGDYSDRWLNWDTPKSALAAVRAGLKQFLNVPDDEAHIKELTSGAISKLILRSKIDAIREALAADGATPESRLVVVYWVGRSFMSASQLHLLVPFSRSVSEPVPFSPTVSLDEMREILAELSAVARTVVIVETPAQELAGPPNWLKAGDVCVVSCEREQFRDRETGLPLLTMWWLKGLREAAATGAPFDVAAITKVAAEKTQFTSINVQKPVIYGADKPIMVVPATYPTVELAIVSALRPAESVLAKVKWAGGDWRRIEAGGTRSMVLDSVKPGATTVRVEADGFEPREVEIVVPKLDGTLRVTIPIAPSKQ